MRLNCFESCLEYVFSQYENLDHRIIFADSFSFGYNKKAPSIGEGLSLTRTGNGISNNISKILACKNIQIIPCFEAFDSYNTICYLDTFFCPSSPLYQIEHVEHYVVLKGQDNGNVIYDDPYYNKYNNSISPKIIYDHKSCFKIVVHQPDELNKHKLMEISLNNIMLKVNGKNQEQALLSFSQDFETSLDTTIEEIKNTSIKTSLLMRQLSYISWGRENYADFLLYMNINNNKVIEHFKMLSTTWALMSNLIIKQVITNNNSNICYIKDTLHKIVENEILAIKILHKL